MPTSKDDVSLVTIWRAPLAEIQPFQRRMGWRFKWLSSYESDFNYDFHVSCTPAEMAAGKAYYNYAELPVGREEQSGLSVFYKDPAGDIFHTYSAFGRGDESATSAPTRYSTSRQTVETRQVFPAAT